MGAGHEKRSRKLTTKGTEREVLELGNEQRLVERERRIRELQARIQAGTYAVSADQLAGCLMRSVPEWFADRAR